MRQEVQEKQSVDSKITWRALYNAIESRDLKALEILKRIKDFPDEQRMKTLQDIGRSSCLIDAIERRMEDLVVELIDVLKVAYPEALVRRDEELGSPANYAFENNQMRILKALWTASREVGKEEEFFSNARMANSDDKFLALIKKQAEEYENPNKVRAAAGVKYNETEDAPLNKAVHDFKLSNMKLLLAMHASPNMGGNQGKTPLQTAVELGEQCKAATSLLTSHDDQMTLKDLSDEVKKLKSKDINAYLMQKQIIDVLDRSCPSEPGKWVKNKVGQLKEFLAEKSAINKEMQDILRRAEAYDTESIITAVISAIENGQSIIVNGVDMTQTHLQMPDSAQDKGASQSI
jgi:hypothetical protein